MKKKVTIILVLLLLSLGVFAQKNSKNSVFRYIYEPAAQVLSATQQARIQKLQQSDNYLSVTLIKFENLQQTFRGEFIAFELPNVLGKSIAKTKSINYATENDFTWNGTLDKGEAFIIHKNKRTFGQIRNNGVVFDIQYLENGYAALIKYNMEKLNQVGCTVQDKHTPQSSSKSLDKNESIGAKKISSDKSPVLQHHTARIRTLVLFTSAAGTTGMNMIDLANTAIAQWRTTSSNSGASSPLVLAGVQELGFIENGGNNNIFEDIADLRNNINAQQLRNQFEADIVLLFTDGNYPGIGGIVSRIGPDDDDAYAIVQIANATSTMTFIHEAGHLFGARHQSSSDDTPGDAHGHGWKKGAFWWKNYYGSIMRTQQSGRERVFHFSNPNVTHRNKATGVLGASNNARVINVNGHVVEGFRFTQPNMSVAIYGPGMKDDGDPLIFTSSVGNGQSPIIYSWQVDIGGGYYTAGTSSTFNYTMPTGTDLDVRLTVTGSDGQTATDYRTVRNSFLGGGCTVCPDSIALDFYGSETTLDNQILELEKPILYPNPSSDKIQLVFKENLSEFDRLQIINLSGEVQNEIGLQPQNKDTGQLTIDISGLRQGTYIIKLAFMPYSLHYG